MPIFVSLNKFTDQGIRNIKDSPKRAEAFRNAAKKAGCNVKELLWTQGKYDLIAIMEAPDDATAAALLLSIGRLGNISSQTLRAFTAAEMEKILEKVV
jgi:uncharacterized protein with GYD domain